MKTSYLIRLLVLGFLAILSTLSFGRIVQLHADINGSQEVPSNASDSIGRATMQFNTEDNTFDLIVTLHKFDEPLLASHIHQAYAGTNGPVRFNLGGESSYTRGKNNLKLKVKRATYTGDVAMLLSGGAYLNFHTAAFPGGEVRGQLYPGPIELMAVADGLQEVPPNGSPATGVVLATYYPRSNTIDLSITLLGFSNDLVGSHIHQAPFGVNGPVVVGIGNESAYTRVGDDLEGDFEDLAYGGDPALLITGGAYVNFHSNVIPSGEVRGQLEVVD